ncbi:DoxX family protein [Anaeromyxobacter sp. Fw109-5]|uniref:DoxX family protein n=1 Tax=Anaeromyxobacter sp. (strain Fw109-5) TaxID=404589 RepID=UPI0000ED7974|nr:DoxX family protein [Anaeromyxobacter sp. Fw109-5]ABS24793.1 conserved hypothetical protein [Anaeromyxobacter sp. Fw109-5]
MSARATSIGRSATSGHGAGDASRTRLWAGRILTALPVLFLLFDGTIKLLKLDPVVESFARLGYPATIARGIGGLELALIAVTLVPRTSLLGAVLLTGYLGGAVSTHVRVGDPLFTHVLFPSYVGVLLWSGLYLRDDRLRTLMASRRGRAGSTGAAPSWRSERAAS